MTDAWLRAKSAAVLVLGMSGVRLDRPARQVVPTVLLIAATVAAQHAAAAAGLVLWSTALAGVLYYVGNTVFCARGVSAALREHLGEPAALRLHEVFLGVAFANQAVALGLIAQRTPGTLAVGGAPIVVACVALSVVGFATKLWAAALTGLDVYYYRDLFLRRPVGELVERGPYRWLSNPMYGLGNVQAYAPGLAVASGPGLLVALLFHVAIYAFHLTVERPFVAHLATATATAAPAAG